jgi:hypothetical protein
MGILLSSRCVLLFRRTESRAGQRNKIVVHAGERAPNHVGRRHWLKLATWRVPAVVWYRERGSAPVVVVAVRAFVSLNVSLK